VFILRVTLLLFRALFRDRSQLALENLALRQQLAALRRKAPRPRLRCADRSFWVSLGYDVAEATVARYMIRFFVIPTATFRLLFCFVILSQRHRPLDRPAQRDRHRSSVSLAEPLRREGRFDPDGLFSRDTALTGAFCFLSCSLGRLRNLPASNPGTYLILPVPMYGILSRPVVSLPES